MAGLQVSRSRGLQASSQSPLQVSTPNAPVILRFPPVARTPSPAHPLSIAVDTMPAPRTQLQVSIRLATVDDDVERLQKIVSTAFSSDKHWFNQSDIAKDERITAEELRVIIKAGVDPLVVAEVNGALAGCLQIQHSRDHPDLNLPQDAAVLGMLAVHHEYGSMGIGGRLARTALALAVRQGCRKALIFVLNKRKDLQQKYERNGFKWNGKTREFRVASGKVLQPDVWYLVYERDISLLEASLIRLGVLDFWMF